MNIPMVKALVPLLMLLGVPCAATKINYDRSRNEIEILHEIEVKEHALRNNEELSYNTYVLIPKAPYDTVKFVISAPRTVYVGQSFAMHFSIHPDLRMSIPFWADLIPDSLQKGTEGLKYISHTIPNIGVFDENAGTISHKGGRGIWTLGGILQTGSVVHMSVMLQATTTGRKKYSTFIATNPPTIVSVAIDAHNEMPIALPDRAQGLQNKSLIIPVLDNDYGMSALRVIAVMPGAHGLVAINADNTLTYIPEKDFVGNDQFSYVVQDAGGNCAQAEVMVMIAECPVPQIIR